MGRRWYQRNYIRKPLWAGVYRCHVLEIMRRCWFWDGCISFYDLSLALKPRVFKLRIVLGSNSWLCLAHSVNDVYLFLCDKWVSGRVLPLCQFSEAILGLCSSLCYFANLHAGTKTWYLYSKLCIMEILLQSYRRLILHGPEVWLDKQAERWYSRLLRAELKF